MLGLAVLFFLGLWVVLTLLATWLGAKFGRTLLPTKGGIIGGFLGFMLLMGGWIVYWIGEYIYIQHTVSHLCETEGGITVYVTPEEWRQQIGEAEWAKSFYTGDSLTYEQRQQSILYFGEEFKPFSQINQRIWRYESVNNGIKGGIHTTNRILYDIKNHKVLYHEKTFAGKVPDNGIKFWLYNIKDCIVYPRYSDIKYKYSSEINNN